MLRRSATTAISCRSLLNPSKKRTSWSLKKYYRINARAPRRSVALLNQIPHKREVQDLFQAAVEVILRDEFFEGEIGQWDEVANLGGHHICVISSCGRDKGGSCYRRLGHSSSAHLDSNGVFQHAGKLRAPCKTCS